MAGGHPDARLTGGVDRPIGKSVSPPRPLLIVSNDAQTCVMFRRLFGRWSRDASCSRHTGSLGLATARVRQPGLIVVDERLPDFEAYEVVSRLRDTKAHAATPLVALTSEVHPAGRARLLRVGASSYLTKPLNIEELRYAVALLLSSPSFDVTA